uniref:zinc finger protein 236-like n=1 Tax=Oncorhynchus gorbuscha TaxID=8017 RepID=UPI001EAF782D|nr:zinc finger protein 236-like [Oncorhynchus gorbuscha]
MLGLRRHLLIHFNNGAYKCSACPKTFISNADLRSHLRSKRSCREKCSDEVITTGFHLKSVPGEYKCPYCGDTFQLPDDLRGHTKDCSRKCHVCGKTTARMLDMRRHMLKHNNNGPYKCPVCPRTFISHTDLKMHLKTKKLCREKCSDVMMNELLSSADGKCRENVNETGVMTRCQQPSSNNTVRPLKSIEEFFEEFSHDLQQSDNSISSEVNLNSLNSLDEDYSDEISQYQPMKDVDLNCLHEDSIMTTEDYSDEISQYPPVKDIDLNTLHEDYSQAEISQYPPVKDVDPVEDRRSVDDSGGNEMANDKEPNSTECLTEEQVSHTEACPLQDSQSETSGEVKNEIQRGKLQAEATGSQGQKGRGRKRKQRRGRGVRNEKTEAKGVKREHSPETEEDAEPSDKELWTSVNERTTVNDSGGVRPSPHCPSSHKREEELQQPIQNFLSEEHSGHMSKGQNREERSESVPQDSLTPEPSNSSHKRSFRSEEHRGHMAEGQNRKERSESEPQDSLTPEPSNSSHKRSQRVKACSFCGKTFTDTLGLTRHMRSHIEQMPHQCTQCGQDFEFSEDLEEHQKHGCEMNKKDNSEENGDDYCGRTVQQKPDLKKKPDLKRGKKPDLKGDKKPDLKGDKKPDLKGDKKPDLKGDKKPDLKGDKKPDLKGDKKPDLKGDKKHDLEGDKKPDLKGDKKTDLKGDKKTDLKGDKKPDLKGDKKTDLKGDKKPDLKGDKKPDLEGDKKSDLEGDKKPDVKGDKKPDLKGDKKTDLEGDKKTDLEGDKKPYLEGDKKPDLKGDTQDCSIKCHVCGKITTRMLGLRRHLLIHFNNGAYKCSACPKTFISNADLRSHLRSKRSCREKCSDEVITTGLHLKSVPGEYKCPYCGDTFQLPDDLRGHTKDCSRKCHVCGKTTARMLDMRRHMLKHNNNGPIKCPVCPRTFIFHTDLKTHLKIKILCRQKCSDVMEKELLSSVDGRSSRFFHETGVMRRCQQPSSSNTGGPSTIGTVLGLKSLEEFFEGLSHDSDISMSSEVNLNSLHEDYSQEVSQYQPIKEIDQSNPGEYKCSHCGDTFQFPHDLKGHTKDCSRKCHVCGKTTSKTCDMRRHMLKHYDGPIKCPVCPKSFMFHTDLKKHLKTKRLCREKCSDVMVKELLSTVDGRCRKNVSETGVMARCQQSASLKSYEEFFEEFPRDSDKSMSSGVNLYSLHEDYSDEISQYQPMKDVDPNSLREDYCDEISQCQHIKDIDADEDDKSLEDSGGNEMPNCHTLDERGCD